jgi:hypothetical protein
MSATNTPEVIMQRIFGLLPISILLTFLMILPGQAATLGQDLDGNASYAAAFDTNYATLFIASESFMSNTLSIRILTPIAGGMWFGALYTVNGLNEPDVLLFQTTPGPVAGNSWNSIAAPAVFIEAGKQYCILVAFQNPQTISIQNPGAITFECSFSGGGPAPNPFLPIENAYPWTIACNVTGTLATATYTSTQSPTATFSATPTATPTSTHSPTYTITPTYTPTHTPTHSPTYTHTPTITQTTTPTYTSTVTPTYTITQTSTSSPTPTITQTITLTITATPTLSPSATSTDVPFKLDHDKIMAYPMPARGDLMRFYVYTPAQSTLTIEIFNIIGEKGETITTDFSVAGYQRIPWDISGVAPGIYLYRATLQSQEGMKSFPVQKIVIVKQP